MVVTGHWAPHRPANFDADVDRSRVAVLAAMEAGGLGPGLGGWVVVGPAARDGRLPACPANSATPANMTTTMTSRRCPPAVTTLRQTMSAPFPCIHVYLDSCRVFLAAPWKAATAPSHRIMFQPPPPPSHRAGRCSVYLTDQQVSSAPFYVTLRATSVAGSCSNKAALVPRLLCSRRVPFVSSSLPKSSLAPASSRCACVASSHQLD